MQLIDIFSGVGGFSLAGDWLGWRTIQFCENNDFCKQVLKKHWPEIPIHDDIKTLTAENVFKNKLYDPREKTIVTAGVPCQPWSNAGKRQGESDDRNLWPETIRFIGSFRPDFAVLENVPGLLNWHRGIFFEDIYTSLETEGYEIWPFIIPSASVGAWDKRERVWIIIYNKDFERERDYSRRRELQLSESMEMEESQRLCCTNNKSRREIKKPINAQSCSKCTTRRGSGSYKPEQIGQQTGKFEDSRPLDQFAQQRETFRGSQTKGEKQVVCSNIYKQCQNIPGVFQNEKRSITGKADCGNKCGVMQSDSINTDIKGSVSEQSGKTWTRRNGCSDGTGDTVSQGLQRYSRNDLSGRKAEQERQAGQANWSRPWIEVASELCGSNARVSHRLDGIKALGNSVNPRVVFEIFKAIEQYNNLKS